MSETRRSRRPDPAFWAGRRVLVTGHTGFKGSWLSVMLAELGAEVFGYALEPTDRFGFGKSVCERVCRRSWIADVRDRAALVAGLDAARPEIVFHLAAQAIVARGYADPLETFSVNVGGTATVLESLRNRCRTAACVIATSDKVYRNDELGGSFGEDAPLGGRDPYSASKAACEFVVSAFRSSFGRELPALVTIRAGNVVGGGDAGSGRLVPDIVAAMQTDEPLRLRCPAATRPWQFVVDVAAGYLLAAEAAAGGRAAPSYNLGPDGARVSVSDLVGIFMKLSGGARKVCVGGTPAIAEHEQLSIDATLAWRDLGWRTTATVQQMARRTLEWHRLVSRGVCPAQAAAGQIRRFFGPDADA